jgi:hypothetical protein
MGVCLLSLPRPSRWGCLNGPAAPAAGRVHPRGDWHSRHGERGGRGIGRTKRWAHVKGHESQNKQRYAGEPGCPAACYRLQIRWSERPIVAKPLQIPGVTRHWRHLAVKKAKMTALVVPSCMFARPNSRYDVNVAPAVYILTSNRPSCNVPRLPTKPSQPPLSGIHRLHCFPPREYDCQA